MKNILLISFMALLIASCSFPFGPDQASVFATQQAANNNEEFAVYNALISTRYVQADTQLIVIRDQTGLASQDNLDTRLANVQKNMPEITPEMLTDFKQKNEESNTLQPMFTLGVKYILITDEQWHDLFTGKDLDGNWEKFYHLYPGSQGIMTLSRAGFNKNMDMALVYVGNSSGPLSGTGYYYLMVKQKGIWIVSKEDMVWIS